MALMHIPDAVATLERDLRAIFGGRLQSMVVYGPQADGSPGTPGTDAHRGHPPSSDTPVTHALAVIDRLAHDDLRACALRVQSWHDAALATPLLISAQEFSRSLDVFPFEFGAILADYVVVSGIDPFHGLHVDAADLRRACEIQARGHLLHLREGYLETRGRADALAVLIVQSAAAFAALVARVAQLDGVDTADTNVAARHVERRLALPAAASAIVGLAGVGEIPSAEAERLFAPYLETVERLATYVDSWTHA
jgi:hypothetical protein